MKKRKVIKKQTEQEVKLNLLFKIKHSLIEIVRDLKHIENKIKYYEQLQAKK